MSNLIRIGSRRDTATFASFDWRKLQADPLVSQRSGYSWVSPTTIPQSSSSEDVLQQKHLARLHRAHRIQSKRFISGSLLTPTRMSRMWMEAASRELDQVSEEADDIGAQRPGLVSVSYASAFIRSLSKIESLPIPSVTPDEDGSVSIQIGNREFIFVLTCCEDKTGIFNVSHKEYALQGHYRNIEVEKIPNSQVFQQISTLLRTATHG